MATPTPVPEGARPTYTRYSEGRFYAVYRLDAPPSWLVVSSAHGRTRGARTLDEVFDLLDTPRSWCRQCALNHD